jgi:hypothetical protein
VKDELAIQPLRDPMVEGLRQQATQLENQRKYVEAAAALDQALAIVDDEPGDPAGARGGGVVRRRFRWRRTVRTPGACRRCAGGPAVPPPLGDDPHRARTTPTMWRARRRRNASFDACRVAAPPRY